MEYENILFEATGTSATIKLNRPEAMNAINGQMVKELTAALSEAQEKPLLRGLVLTAEGQAFCVGADLKFALGELSAERELKDGFIGDVAVFLSRLEGFPLPVVGAVNGMALAGGLELLLCCDYIIAVESALFGDAHSNYGLIPGGGATQRLPRRLGMSRAKQLLYLGEFYPARTMEQWGLVNEVVPDGSLEQAVDAFLAKLAAKSPLVLRRMKALSNVSTEVPLKEGLEMEIEAMEAHRHSHDMNEGLLAFKEKRPPVFTGD